MLRKLPALTPENSPFWQGGAGDRLMIDRCLSCRHYFHPPAPVCPRCASQSVVPEPVSGRGQVFSFTINRQAWDAETKEPYVVAIIELAEQPGLRFVSNVIECAPEDVSIGMPVVVRFLQQDDVWVPLFAPEVA